MVTKRIHGETADFFIHNEEERLVEFNTHRTYQTVSERVLVHGMLGKQNIRC